MNLANGTNQVNGTHGPIRLSVDDRGIAILRMQDPARKNAFGRDFVAGLRVALTRLADESVKVCIIAGEDDVFSSGGDRDVLTDLAAGRLAPYDLDLTGALLDVPVPTIAAMAGHAVGGGLVFGIACDMVLLARESRYGCNFMDLGFTPGMGTTSLLKAAVGEYLAAEMMFGAPYLLGAHLEGRGQINDVLPKVEVFDRAMALADRIADKPREALTLLKRTLSLPRRRAFEEARTIESMMHDVCFARPETRDRIRENFIPVQQDQETEP